MNTEDERDDDQPAAPKTKPIPYRDYSEFGECAAHELRMADSFDRLVSGEVQRLGRRNIKPQC